jgi:hypothetical protein
MAGRRQHARRDPTDGESLLVGEEPIELAAVGGERRTEVEDRREALLDE